MSGSVASVWLFSALDFQMSPQIACFRWCIIAMVAFVWFFLNQMACLRGCIVTLVAFVWLFATVCFHMSSQIAFERGRIIALVAFVQLHDIFSPFHGDFHILFAHVVIFKNFLHNLFFALVCSSNGYFLILRQVWGSRRSARKRESENIKGFDHLVFFPDHIYQSQKITIPSSRLF